MDSAEIIVNVVKRDGRDVIIELLEKAFVSRVNLPIFIRIVRFCRSTWLVEMCVGSGRLTIPTA
jgi:hypothetical protein